jgi:hypothetical protein
MLVTLRTLREPRIWSATLGVWLSLLGTALARPGGGETFSGPSDSGGGDGHGDGGDGAELVFLLIRLVFMYPRVGVPLAIVALIAFVVMSKRRGLENWDTPHHGHVVTPPRKVVAGPRDVGARLTALRQLDPDFSRVVFEDFMLRLYAGVHRARDSELALDALAPYLDDALRTALLRQDGAQTQHVIVGALRIEDVALPAAGATPAWVRIQLCFEANVLLRFGAVDRNSYVRERWTLARAAEARTKPPGTYEKLGCPNCGAPFSSSDHRRCAYCGQVVSDGRFNWQLVQRQVLDEQALPGGLGSHAEERGTDLPNVVAPDFPSAWRALVSRDPSVAEAALTGRVELIYTRLNAGWSAQQLGPVRGLVSDGLYDYLSYWVEAYRAAGLRNVLEQGQIERCQPVKVVEDRFYAAITLRIFAHGLDYTLKAESGELVSGDQSTPRRYSEYWTLIRSAGVHGVARTDASCPNCAAPLSVSMAGSCTHCGAHITGGEFDWVLSKIEQDDVYEG